MPSTVLAGARDRSHVVEMIWTRALLFTAMTLLASGTSSVARDPFYLWPAPGQGGLICFQWGRIVVLLNYVTDLQVEPYADGRRYVGLYRTSLFATPQVFEVDAGPETLCQVVGDAFETAERPFFFNYHQD